MSWRSPLTVPMTAVASGRISAATRSGSNSAVASFIARAAMSISGTKISLRWNWPPTLVIARYGAPSGVSTRFSQVTASLFRAFPTASICTDRSIVLVVQAFSFVGGATFESTG